MWERERDGSGRAYGAGGPGFGGVGVLGEEEEPDGGSELDADGRHRRRDGAGRRGQVLHHAPRSHPRTRPPHSRPLVVLPIYHSRPWQGHCSQLGGLSSMYLLTFFFSFWFWFWLFDILRFLMFETDVLNSWVFSISRQLSLLKRLISLSFSSLKIY